MFFFEKNEPDLNFYQLDSNGSLNQTKPLYTYWWDNIPNFGDWIGPYLLAKMTDRPLVNTKGLFKENVLFSVGSVIEHIDKSYPQAKIWGSGLIQIPHLKRSRKINSYVGKVYAVRGVKTYQALQNQTNLVVPKVFGDPALLMPEFYEPKRSIRTKKISVCPHFSHYQYFEHLNSSEKLNVIDVKKPLLQVVDAIVNSEVCIATSLHGLIIAQAYGIPWVWLTLEGYGLDGDTFKFEDFFSTLTRTEHSSQYKMRMNEINEITLVKISQVSRVNTYKYSLDALIESCPIHDDNVYIEY